MSYSSTGLLTHTETTIRVMIQIEKPSSNKFSESLHPLPFYDHKQFVLILVFKLKSCVHIISNVLDQSLDQLLICARDVQEDDVLVTCNDRHGAITPLERSFATFSSHLDCTCICMRLILHPAWVTVWQ